MGRRALAQPRKRYNVMLEEHLIARFTLQVFDPASASGYPYGALSEMLNKLLAAELDRLDANKPQPLEDY